MAEGMTPGAPQISGTDEDPSHFHHQPPPVDGVNFGSQPDSIDHAAPQGGFRLPEALRRGSRSRRGTRARSHSSRDQPRPDDTKPPDSPAVASPLLSPNYPTSPTHSSSEPHVQTPNHHSTPPSPAIPETPRRAHFPDEPAELTRAYSAPERAPTIPPDLNGAGYDGEKDRLPAAHRGLWQDFRNWMADWKHDLGSPDKEQDTQDLIGDIGIDLQTIRKLMGSAGKKARQHGNHNRVSSLIAPSVMLARPGLGTRTESASTIHTLGSNTTCGSTAPTSGTVTPGTARKIFGVGVDPQELSKALKKIKSKVAHGDSKQAKYVQAKAELGHRRNLVLLMVYAFMAYGAPSHRIEEYTLHLMKVLDMDGRVNYTVGCTEISFINPIDPEDPMTRSAYTTIVKAQGLDIGACESAFRIYKDIVHGEVDVNEATESLKKLIDSPSYYKPWFIVPFYGMASALTCIWAYSGYWTDMPIAWFLGCIVGTLQVIVAAKNPLYSNVLEVTAAFITSFGARAFSSIGGPDQKYFCFGSISESSITTILPGYVVLCGSLELQSKSITAGSTRLFYAVIYSLLLGYGMAVGSQIWGSIHDNAVNSATCPRSVDPKWKILLVPCYLVIQAVLIRSRPRQIPIQVIIGSAAYTVNYFVSKHTTAQVAVTASALVLGILGHLWARSQRAFAFAAVVAGMYVLVFLITWYHRDSGLTWFLVWFSSPQV